MFSGGNISESDWSSSESDDSSSPESDDHSLSESSESDDEVFFEDNSYANDMEEFYSNLQTSTFRQKYTRSQAVRDVVVFEDTEDTFDFNIGIGFDFPNGASEDETAHCGPKLPTHSTKLFEELDYPGEYPDLDQLRKKWNQSYNFKCADRQPETVHMKQVNRASIKSFQTFFSHMKLVTTTKTCITSNVRLPPTKPSKSTDLPHEVSSNSRGNSLGQDSGVNRKKKRVCINTCPEVFVLSHWAFAHRAARNGSCYLMAANDRCRFGRRIQDLARVINPVLDVALREKVFKERFLGAPVSECY